MNDNDIDTTVTPNRGPLWIEGEKLYGQRFFYNNTYISSALINIENIEAPKKERKKPMKKNKKFRKDEKPNKINNPQPANIGLMSLVESFDKFRKQLSFPEPGISVQSVLKTFNIFSDGLNKLFPNGEPHDKLSTSLNETDNIYLIVGLYSLLCNVDHILQKQILSHIEKQNFQIDLPGKTVEIISSLIEKSINKTNSKNQSTVQKEPEIFDVKERPPVTWQIDTSLKKFYLTQHKMEFIENNKFVCFICRGIFDSNPVSHIIDPSHIHAVSYKT